MATSLGLLANPLDPLAFRSFRKKTGKLPARSHLEATGYVPEAPGQYEVCIMRKGMTYSAALSQEKKPGCDGCVRSWAHICVATLPVPESKLDGYIMVINGIYNGS